MKLIRISMSVSGFMLVVLGPLEHAAADSSRPVPLRPGIQAAVIQRSEILPPIPATTLEKLQTAPEDNRRHQIGVGRQLTRPFVVNRNTVPLAQWAVLPDGWSVWSAEVGSQGALGLRLHIECIQLPKGARLLVYDPENPAAESEVITGTSLGRQRDIWTGTLFSEQAIVECQVPPGINPNLVSFVISGVSHLFALPMLGPTPKEGSCHNDVTCYPDYAQQAAGVARMAFVQGGNTYTCTGCRLAGNDSSQAYFLTANHCIYDQAIASTIELFWFYQTTTCNGTPPALSSVPRTTGGADLLATSNGNDFSFMRLRQMPPSGATPLTWNTSPPSGGETLACIHHPTGAYKRISFGNAIGATANFWGVRWSSGATEGGSSGSPLLNANHQLIGQLNAGFNGGAGSSCTDTTAPDQFGRFDVTYPAIQQWLNSGGGGGPPPTPTFVAGTYNGLFVDGGGPALNNAGVFTVSVTARGRYSARLQIGAVHYAMAGQLDSTGAAQFSVPRRNLSGQLQIDPNDADHITGSITDGSFNSQLDGDRVVFNTRNLLGQGVGTYTVVIPNGPDPTTSPGGNSYGTMTLDRLGRVRLAGALADGTRFSSAATLSKNGRWPLYSSLYGGNGMVISWVTLGDTGSADLSGQMTWIRPSLARVKMYPSGFSYQADLVGSFYVRPPPGGQVLALTDANVAFSGGDLSDSITDPITIGPNSRVANQGSNRMSLSFSPGNGLFHGSVFPPGSRRAVAFSGVVLQRQNAAYGYFLGQMDSGNVAVGQ